MDQIVSNFLRGIGVFWGGIHFIGFLMYSGGNTNHPLWHIILGIIKFELWLLGIAVAAFAIYITYEIVSDATANVKPYASGSAQPIHTHEPTKTQITELAPVKTTSQIHMPTSVEHDKPKPPPLPPKPLSAHELKLKALKQITGKEFLK